MLVEKFTVTVVMIDGSELRGDKFAVIFKDGTEKVVKNTDPETLVDSLDLDTVADIFDV